MLASTGGNLRLDGVAHDRWPKDW
ncbi:MAG: hypothetical protein QOE61_4566, partial [Micromonosporaceae bacterium]|nr:hypothetical protein [Micromonosporaceae bacterium]